MKVLHVMATSGGIGGLETHSFNLCRQLSAQGLEVHLLIDQRYHGLYDSLNSVHIHAVDFSQSRRNPLLLYKIYQLIKQVQPDLIHAQGGKATKIIASLLRWIDIPSVATVHGMKNHLQDYRNFDRVITVSAQVAQKFKDIRDVVVIHNGVQLEQATTPVYLENPPRAIAIGRLDAVKGFDRLIQAWVGIDFSLDIIGEGAERKNLEKLIMQHGLQDKVRLLGFKQNIAQEITHSCFVIVSSLKEGGPIVVAEALLNNVPVISTDVGMAKEYIPVQYIAEMADVQLLQQLIQWTLQRTEQQLLDDFKPAFLKAEQSLTLHAMSMKTMVLYQALIKL